MSDRDLWPANVVDTPVNSLFGLLREQAGLLGPKTGGLVLGEVTTRPADNRLVHSFRLVAPRLDGYRYTLFRVAETIDEDEATLLVGDEKRPVHGLDGLTRELQEIFGALETGRIIGKLVAMSRDRVSPAA